MKQFIDPLPTGGIPFFADDFLMLQTELFKASLYMYSSLSDKIILSGCVPNFGSTTFMTGIAIASISSGYVLLPDADNDDKPTIFALPTTTLPPNKSQAWIVKDTDVETIRTMKTGGDKPVLTEKFAKLVYVDPGGSVPSIFFDPLPTVYLNDLIFRHSKRIGEIVPIGRIQSGVNPMFYGATEQIPLFLQTNELPKNAGYGKYSYNGFAICNGGNNTADLSGKFMAGYTTLDTHFNFIGATGGLGDVYLNINQIPRHNHNVYGTPGQFGLIRRSLAGENVTSAGGAVVDTGASGNEPDLFTIPQALPYEGNNMSHENRPPYYTVLYVQRIF